MQRVYGHVCHALRNQHTGHHERRIALLRMLFDSWDGDNSGEVDVGEMVTAVRAFGEGQSEEASREEALQVVQQMDADQDGSITWEEFLRFFTTLFADIREEVFDEVIATVIATTKARPYRGWILDGFPTTSVQAKLLEKALSGYVEPAVMPPSATFHHDLSTALAPPTPDPLRCRLPPPRRLYTAVSVGSTFC